MAKILLLGPGTNPRRVRSDKEFDCKADEVYVVDRAKSAQDYWFYRGAIQLDVPLELSTSQFGEDFDEVHGYEIFNLLPGDAHTFFSLWGRISRCLKKGGRVYGTVPHWESEWIYAYPGQQRVYTIPLLLYLDTTASLGAKEDFSYYWPPENDLKLVEAAEVLKDGKKIGLYFILEKVND